MAQETVPLRTQSAAWMRGGLKNRMGSLLLYPDKLCHVGSKAAQVGGGFGALGVLVTRGIANAQAPKKVSAGHKAVIAIPLSNVTEVRGVKGKMGNRLLIVRTANGEEYKFRGVKFDEWSDDLNHAFRASGRTPVPTESGFTVT